MTPRTLPPSYNVVVGTEGDNVAATALIGAFNTVPTSRWEQPVAWMAMMGADSVDYHRETVLHRADDHPGQALAYYASRGETPLMWGGSGARALGLVGSVTDDQYAALFGPGGAVDPTTGERLVSTRRPGMELVIAAHKSVAELGSSARPGTCTASWTQNETPPWPTSTPWPAARAVAGAGRRWPHPRPASPTASPATPPPGPATPPPTITCWWPTCCAWTTRRRLEGGGHVPAA